MQVGKTHLIVLTVVFLTVTPVLPLFAQEHLAGEYISWERPCPAVLPANEMGDCFCNPEQSLIGSVSLDLLILSRSSADKINVLYANSRYSDPVLNVKDLGFDAQTGLRVNVMLSSQCGCDLLFTYMGMHDLAETGHRSDPGLFWRFYNAIPARPWAGAYFVEYESHLDDAEFNVRTRQWGHFAPIAGMRITQLEEVFNIVEDTTDAAGARSDTENEMYGIQFGTELLIREFERSRIEGAAKAIVYFNDIAITANADDAGGALLELDRDYWHTSLGGELKLAWVYQCCRNVSIRVGYEAFWLDGVALAPDQSDNFNIFTGEGSLDLGSTFYQGGYIGGDITW